MSANGNRYPDAWQLAYEGYEPDSEGHREALCAIGNGYFVTRAAAPEARADPVHYPGTYVAGLYNRLESELETGCSEEESLVNLPNWLAFSFRIADGPWFDLEGARLLDYRQVLDVRRGVLARSVRYADAHGRITRFETEAFAHMRHEHVGVLTATITAENWSGALTVRSALDGRVENAGVERYQPFNGAHLEALGSGRDERGRLWLRVGTVQSRIKIALACEHRVHAPGAPCARSVTGGGEREAYIAEEIRCELAAGTALRVEKVMALCTSRDRGMSEAKFEALRWLSRLASCDDLLQAHTLEWAYLWSRCDLLAALEPKDLLALRLHVFQLLQTASLHTIDGDAGIPARGWHGEAYRGHVFWDELFVFPYLNFRIPEVARALLLYRYRRLPEARAAAQAAGYAGAMYPWQSGSDGREETQRWDMNPMSGHLLPDHTRLQRHIGAAVAYNVWYFDQVTGDREFLYFYGAEMMLEVARFWASIAIENASRGRFEIHGVMGPDEFHDAYPDRPERGLRNNAYTNVMAAWVLWRALELLEAIPQERRDELTQLLQISDDDLRRWDRISRSLFVPFHDGVISQFEGYEALEELDWAHYRERYGDIHRLDRILEAEGDTPNRYKLSKQADVVMLFYLFNNDELTELFGRMGYEFDEGLRRRTVDYYMARTSHGSTLSRVVHSWVLARGGRRESWSLFSEALWSDLADIQGGTTAEGIHLGAMAGSVDLVQRGYTGLTVREAALSLDPRLPANVTGLEFRLRYRQSWIGVAISEREVRVRVSPDALHPLVISVRKTSRTLHPGDEASFALD